MERLSPEETNRRLAKLPGWSLKDEALFKEFEFDSFAAAFGFMTRLALAAEKMDHHPDWSNSYNKVSISLTTHSAQGVTAPDFSLAALADQLAV